MENCIFCKIASGELPSTKIYEDEDIVAFLDIRPVTKGHTLIVPKQHSTNILDTDPRVLACLAEQVPKISRAVIAGVGADAFNFSSNNGAAAGQIVFHLHFHIIPRFSQDGLRMWQHGSYAEGEQEQVGEKIRSAISSSS